MAGLTDDLVVTEPRFKRIKLSDSASWTQNLCAHCSGDTAVVIAATEGHVQNNFVPATEWLRCTRCQRGSVRNFGVVSPAASTLATPRCLPPDVEAAWIEARLSLSSGAPTAATMMCRKILFHIAVDKGLPEKRSSDGKAPSFYEALRHLQAEGWVTPPVKPWVERIKDVGNDSNHEITSIATSAAQDIASFTEQLLRLVYELPAMAAIGNESST